MTGGSSDQPRTYPSGVTSWVDTEQPDVAAALRFYGGLFGWTFEEVMPADAPGRYVIAKLDGLDVAAIASLGPDAPVRRAAWHTYVATGDPDASARRVSELGADLEVAPVDAGPGGEMASFRDPEGAQVRLWQARRRLGVQLANVPGGWNFSDLHRRRSCGRAARRHRHLPSGFGLDEDGHRTGSAGRRVHSEPVQPHH